MPAEPDPLEAISPAPAPSRPARLPRPEPGGSGGPARGSLLHAGPRDSIRSTDITLQTVLNHIAYISHPATVRQSPKYQVQWVHVP